MFKHGSFIPSIQDNPQRPDHICRIEQGSPDFSFTRLSIKPGWHTSSGRCCHHAARKVSFCKRLKVDRSWSSDGKLRHTSFKRLRKLADNADVFELKK
ncbi:MULTISPECIES: hypothetical protein [unclassified Ensifer]|uniref:hypothetical protein n=1 Tax=unclassified Ensifer TaxID=2633371 RepID=UPI0012E34329|nr:MULTISPECIES: hypothetical protein [unclassified Ensifer]